MRFGLRLERPRSRRPQAGPVPEVLRPDGVLGLPPHAVRELEDGSEGRVSTGMAPPRFHPRGADLITVAPAQRGSDHGGQFLAAKPDTDRTGAGRGDTAGNAA